MYNAVNIKTFERYNWEYIGILDILLLHYLITKATYFGNEFYYPDAKIRAEIGFTKFQLLETRKRLISLDFIHTKRGVQSKLSYWINLDGIYARVEMLVKPQFKAQFIKELAELNSIYKNKKLKIS